MLNCDDLKDFYRHDMAEAVSQFESFRKRMIARIISFAVLLAGMALTVYIMGRSGGNGFMGGVVFFVSVPLFGYIVYRTVRDYRLAYKRELIAPLVKKIAPQATYSPQASVPEQQFLNSGLFDASRYSRFTGEDLVQGVFNGIEMQFSELNVTKSGQKSDTVVFRGIYLVAYMKNPFPGTLRVVPDLGAVLPNNALGRMLQGLIEQFRPTPPGTVVKAGNPEFDGIFRVYAEDEVNASDILTPKLCEQLLKLQEIAQHTLRVCFDRDTLYIALDVTDDLFEIPFLKTVKSYDIVHRFVSDLGHALAVLDLISEPSIQHGA